jgi:energy-coupling factor transporter ATP-binding protein EcfA2
MRQRCALIRTLAAPRILLLDEPFSALDYQTRLAVSADIFRIIRQEHKTALLVTHDISEAISMSDRVIVLSPARRGESHHDLSLRGLSPIGAAGRAGVQHLFSIPYGRSWMSMPENALPPRRLAYLRAGAAADAGPCWAQIAAADGFLGQWELSARLGLDGRLRGQLSLPGIAATLGSSTPPAICGSMWAPRVWRRGRLHPGHGPGHAHRRGLWWSDFASRVLDPYLVVLNALPKTALGPIFIVWMGAGTASIITMTLAISIIVTILNMHVGFRLHRPSKDPADAHLRRQPPADTADAGVSRQLPTLFNTLKVNVGCPGSASSWANFLFPGPVWDT